MGRTWIIGLGLSVSLTAGTCDRKAMAQGVPTGIGTGTTVPSAAIMANPYLNPYLNPYMNPMATQRPMTAGNAAIYLYAANSANGGIWSGRISGTRGGPAKGRVAEMPNELPKPGGGAAKYFNPGPVNVTGAGRYYGQRKSYFQNNGR